MAVFKIDCDGVLRNLLQKMCDIYNAQFGTNIKPCDCVQYEVDKVFTLCQKELGMSAKEFLFNVHGEQLFGHSDVCFRAKEAMDLLHLAGHKIIIVTWQRSTQNKIDTLKWLEKNNIYYDDIAFTNKKDQIKGDYMVDDNVDFLNEITKPTIPICINAPYNKDVDFYPRYDSLYQFVINFLSNK